MVVKPESFLQRHQLPSAPSGHYWCIVGTAWRGQWLARTMKLGATQRTRPLHDGKEQRRKQMLPQRTHRRGERERELEIERHLLSLSLSGWVRFVFYSSAAGEKTQQLYLHLAEWCSCSVQQDKVQRTAGLSDLCTSLLWSSLSGAVMWDISQHCWDQTSASQPQCF